MNRIVTGVFALAAGIAIGWFIRPMAKREQALSIREELAKASEVLDAERRTLAVKTALDKADTAELASLTEYVEDLANRRPDIPLREEFLRRWGEKSPREALAYLGSDARLRDQQAILTAWGRTDPDGAVNSFQAPTNDRSESSLAKARALLAGLAETDPEKAIRFADRFSLADLDRLEFRVSSFPVNHSFEPSGSYQEAIDFWIRHDSAAAFEVIRKLGSPEVREQALNELFHTWHWEDPRAADAAADRVWQDALGKNHPNDPPMSSDLLETLANHRGEAKGREAYESALQVIDPDLRSAAIKAALGGWKGWDGKRLPEIADFLVNTWTNLTNATADEVVSMVIATEWAARELAAKNHDLKTTVAFLDKLPTGKAQEAAIEGIVSGSSWPPETQVMIRAWIDALPPSNLKDTAAARFALRIADQSPADALELATNIEESTLRSATLASVAARFIPKEQGGTKPFDLEQWARDHPEIMKELLAAGGER